MNAAEEAKYRKHELPYAQVGYSFLAFVSSCFGALGPSAIRYLWALAMLELRQHETLRNRQGLDPLTDSERAQYRAGCFRSSSARVAAAMTRATIMRLLGTPSIPVTAPVPRHMLAQNLRGVPDLCDPRQAPLAPSPLPPIPPPLPSAYFPDPQPLDLLRPPSHPPSPSHIPLSSP